MKKNIRQVAENFITVSDENFKGRIKAKTAGSTHTLNYFADSGDMPIVAIDDSASTVTSYIDGTLMGAAAKNFNKQVTTASAQTALDMTIGTVGGQLLAETETASARTRLDLGDAALKTIGTSIGNAIELVTGSATSAASLPAVSADKLLNLPTGLSAPDFTSTEQTVTANTLLSVAHSLGAKPTLFTAVLICKTTQHGYSVDDEAFHMNSTDQGSDGGVTVAADSANIVLTQGNQIYVNGQSSFNAEIITVGNWRWIVRAWT